MKFQIALLALTLVPAAGLSSAAAEAAKEAAAPAAKAPVTPTTAAPAAGAQEAKPAAPAKSEAEVPPERATPSNPPGALNGALGAKWGLSSAQVSAAVPNSDLQPSGDVMLLPATVEGAAAGIHYQFHEDKLVSVHVVFDEPAGTPIETRRQSYAAVGERLAKRFGKPMAEKCNEDKSECARWWGDGDTLLVLHYNPTVHRISHYIIKVREQLMEDVRKNNPMSQTPEASPTPAK